MSEVVITKLDNGPFLVKGEVTLTDGAGNKYPSKETIYLCRCGQSTNQPFCSGAHKNAGYVECSVAQQ